MMTIGEILEIIMSRVIQRNSNSPENDYSTLSETEFKPGEKEQSVSRALRPGIDELTTAESCGWAFNVKSKTKLHVKGKSPITIHEFDKKWESGSKS